MARIPRKSSKSIAKCTIFKQDKVPVFETMSVLRVGMSLLRFCHHQRGHERHLCAKCFFAEWWWRFFFFFFFLQDYLIPSGEEAKEKIAHNLMRTKEVPK